MTMTPRTLAIWVPFLAMLLLAGCSKTVTWKEEVRLSDGRVIVVERETLRAPGGDDLAHGGSGTTPKERRIRFEYPPGSGKWVEWRSTRMSPGLVPEIPLVFDIQAEKPVVLTSVAVSEGCSQYLKYVNAHGNQWLEDALPEEFESVMTNLYLKSGPSMPLFVDLPTKNKENTDIRYPRRLKQVGPSRILCHG